MATGIVTWYQLNTGTTEIRPDEGGVDVTGHHMRMSPSGGFNPPLVEGQHVSYDTMVGPQNYIMAINIEPIE